MNPAVLRTKDLAVLMGVDPKTVYMWQQTDAALAGCVIRRTKHSTWWSTARLQERGYLPRDAAPSSPAIIYDYKVAL